MKGRASWDNPEKYGSAGHLQTRRTKQRAEKKSRRKECGKTEETAEFWLLNLPAR
jgi:hypothetical protein